MFYRVSNSVCLFRLLPFTICHTQPVIAFFDSYFLFQQANSLLGKGHPEPKLAIWRRCDLVCAATGQFQRTRLSFEHISQLGHSLGPGHDCNFNSLRRSLQLLRCRLFHEQILCGTNTPTMFLLKIARRGPTSRTCGCIERVRRFNGRASLIFRILKANA